MMRGLRLAARRLRRAPLFSLSVCLVLALTGAALTAVGVIAYGILVAPLPYAEPAELVFIQNQSLRSGELQPLAPADYLDLREQAGGFESMAAAELWSPVWTGDDEAERLHGLRVGGELFRLLGVAPQLGRTIEPADDKPEAERVAVISDRLWRRSLGADPGVLGRTLRLDGELFQVIGVMPPGFEFPTFWTAGVDLWAPFRWSTAQAGSRDASSLRVFGRLADGVELAAAQAEVATIAAALRERFPASHADRGAAALSIQEATVRQVRPTLVALAAGAALLWLIAIANVAVLAVVRASGRTKEAAVRRALGESNAAGLAHEALENGLLAGFGCLLGATLGIVALRTSAATAPAEWVYLLARWEELPRLGLVLVAFLTTALPAAGALTLAARLPLSTGPLADRLRARAAVDASHRSATLRSALTAGEVALAVALVAAAGLVGRSLLQLVAVSPGFEPERVTTAVIPVSGSSYGDPARKAGFYRTLLERLERTPGVEAAAAVNHAPLVGDRWGANFLVEGDEPPAPGSEPNAAYRVATPDYFRTVGARLLQGRDFGAADDQDAPPVVIVNRTLANRHFPGQTDVIGRRIRLGGIDSDAPWRTIVGVVADLQQQTWADVGAEIFLPFEQDAAFRESVRAPFAMTVVVRTAAGAGPATPILRQAVGELDPAIPLDRVLTLEQAVDNALWQPRLAAALLGVFAVLALLLATIGVYGAAAQAVLRRRAEFGVGMGLGATRQGIVGLAVGQGFRLIAAGVLAGAGFAWLAAGLLADLLYQVSARDGLVFAGACLALAGAGLVATYLPARRAASIDPVTALRQE